MAIEQFATGAHDPTRPASPTKHRPGQGPRSLRGLRVLVVDDDPASAKLLAVVLGGEGCEVRTAASAEEASQALPEFGPAVIVVDLVLPLMGGLVFAEQVKADPKTAAIVIIAVSAFNGRPTEQAALAAGCAAYFRKPIDPLQFPARVCAALEGAP